MEDLKRIYSLINSPDKLLKNDSDKDVIVLELFKEFTDRTITCIAEIRPRKKELIIITMYKNWIK